VPGPANLIRDRIDDLLYERPPTPARIAAVVAALLATAALVVLLWWPAGAADPARLPFVTAPPTTVVVAVALPEVVVHVAGAVARPGLYVLPEGRRVADALARAGGVLADGRGDLLNLAAPLRDGSRIWVPSGDLVVDPGIHDAPAVGGPVDVNRAGIDELQDLPGVGPSLAAAIVRHRDRMGPFTSVEDLLAVPGIGPSTLAGLLDRVVL